MKLKNLVSVIVAGLVLCIMLGITCEAAATTKATTKDKETEMAPVSQSEAEAVGTVTSVGAAAKDSTKSEESKAKKKADTKKTTAKKKTTSTAKKKADTKKTAKKNSKKTTTKKSTNTKVNKTTKKNALKKNQKPAVKKKTGKKVKTANTAAKNKKKTDKKNTKVTSTPQFNFTDSDVRYLTSIIYCEARGEGYAGQKAVGIVVMNRVRDYQFPNSIIEVIYQKGQFSPVGNGSLNRALSIFDSQWSTGYMQGDMASCMLAAREALMGSTTVNVSGGTVDMGSYLFFSRYIRNARFQLGAHQFK